MAKFLKTPIFLSKFFRTFTRGTDDRHYQCHFQALLGLLRDVMAGAGHSVVEDTREDLDTIITAVCDPLTHMLDTTAAKLPRLD